MSDPRATADLDTLLSVAVAVADAAAVETLRFFRRRDLQADDKSVGGFDPVTEADRAAERAMRRTLARLRPADGILGEEEAAVPSRSGLPWVLDPIDGTRAYLAGAPTWGTLVALRDEAGVLLGLVDQPWTGERFCGAAGQAWLDRGGVRQPLATRPPRKLADAILYTTFPEIGSAAGFRRVAAECRLVRYGLDCYAYALLAAGQIDLVIEAGLQPYDVAAPIGLVEAAAGIVTGWTGDTAAEGGRVLAAANARVHAAALALLQAG